MSEQGQALIAEVRRIAAANPDFIYPEPHCSYLMWDQPDECSPSCIMGQALWNLGHLGTDERRSLVPEGKAISDVLVNLGIAVDPDEGFWLNAVQAAQDGRVAAVGLKSQLEQPFNSTLHGRHSFSEAVAYGDAVAAERTP